MSYPEALAVFLGGIGLGSWKHEAVRKVVATGWSWLGRLLKALKAGKGKAK